MEDYGKTNNWNDTPYGFADGPKKQVRYRYYL